MQAIKLTCDPPPSLEHVDRQRACKRCVANQPVEAPADHPPGGKISAGAGTHGNALPDRLRVAADRVFADVVPTVGR